MGHPIRLNSTLKVPRIKNLQISLLTLFAACRISLYDTKVWPYCDRYPPGLLQVDLYIRSITPSHIHTVLHYFPSTCLPYSRSYQSLHGFLVCLPILQTLVILIIDRVYSTFINTESHKLFAVGSIIRV